MQLFYILTWVFNNILYKMSQLCMISAICSGLVLVLAIIQSTRTVSSEATSYFPENVANTQNAKSGNPLNLVSK